MIKILDPTSCSYLRSDGDEARGVVGSHWAGVKAHGPFALLI